VINGTDHDTLLTITFTINDYQATAMIDSGASGNFMTPKYVRRYGLPTQRKRHPYKLGVVDGTLISQNNGTVDRETRPLRMIRKGHEEWIQFDIVSIGHHDIILGIPWLRKHNPSINWKTDSVRFENCECKIRAKPGSRETERQRNLQSEICAISPRKIDKVQKKDPNQVKCMWIRPEVSTGIAVPQIPSEYQEFRELFEERPAESALPKHQPWDHEIPLEDGKQPTYGPLYSMFERQLKAVREYL
jgi:hypothetical protein